MITADMMSYWHESSHVFEKGTLTGVIYMDAVLEPYICYAFDFNLILI